MDTKWGCEDPSRHNPNAEKLPIDEGNGHVMVSWAINCKPEFTSTWRESRSLTIALLEYFFVASIEPNTRTCRKVCRGDWANADLTVASASGSHCCRMPPGTGVNSFYMTIFMKTIVVVLLVFWVATLCGASTIDALTNLPSLTSNVNGDNLGSESAAVELTIGSSDVTFDSLTGFFSNTTSGQQSIAGGIYAGSASSPGTLIESFTSQTIAAHTSSPTSFTFVTPLTVTLSANTNYWFEFLDPVSFFLWNTAGNGNGTAPTAANGFSSSGYDINTGSAWVSSAVNATVDIQVDTISSATPEPGTATLAQLSGILLAAAAAFQRRRRTPDHA